jgi:hypothetical protein
LNLSGVVTPQPDGHFDLSLNTHISSLGKDDGSPSETEGWSNRFELALNLDEPASALPASGREWKLRAGRQINSRSVAREAIRVLLVESSRAADQGLQRAVAQVSDQTDSESYTVRVSQMSPTGQATGKGAPTEREHLALVFDTQPGDSTMVRCAFGTTECIAKTQLLPSQTSRLRADTAIAFMEHDKSFSPEKMGQPHEVLRQVSARTTVHTKPGESTSIGESPRAPGQAASAGLRIRIDALPTK